MKSLQFNARTTKMFLKIRLVRLWLQLTNVCIQVLLSWVWDLLSKQSIRNDRVHKSSHGDSSVFGCEVEYRHQPLINFWRIHLSTSSISILWLIRWGGRFSCWCRATCSESASDVLVYSLSCDFPHLSLESVSIVVMHRCVSYFEWTFHGLYSQIIGMPASWKPLRFW